MSRAGKAIVVLVVATFVYLAIHVALWDPHVRTAPTGYDPATGVVTPK